MSTTLTVDAVARVYEEAFDPNYAKQLDRGDTKVAVAPIVPTTNLLLSGTSHALKTHAKAGSGRRSTFSTKDECVDDGETKKDTVVITGYHAYNNEDSVERSCLLLEAQYTYLSANNFAEWKKLLRGGINFA